MLGVTAVSFGLESKHGAPADPAAFRNALLRGVDLAGHRSARAESSSFTKGDLIIVFEPAHLAAIWRLHPGALASLLGIWSRPVRPHIQDPYGRSDKYFQECFSIVDATVAELVRQMVRSRICERAEGLRNVMPEKSSRGRTVI